MRKYTDADYARRSIAILELFMHNKLFEFPA